ncbi:gamma-glutamyltransferase [Polymorphobacter sp.]|uniref:gamma-glutamyltransferase n=1 Tax=Polymorphobacter sp. TaxID=1909290 RepID=UPI003F707E1A
MHRFLLAPLLLLAACATTAPPQATVPSYAGVASAAHPLAAQAGREILQQGGSAADAAAAVMLALTVVEPQSSGIGGGGFLVYQPPRGPALTIDGRETAPAVARPGQYLKPDGQPMPFREAATGGHAVGVPGNVALIAEAHKRWGRLPWAALFAPAIRLAQGFEVSDRMAQFVGFGREALSRSAEARALYFDAAGQPVKAGTRFANPALAATLQTLADQGADAFYKGSVGTAVVRAVSTAEAAPTAMTMADLAAYGARVAPPVCGSYRQYTVCGMGPPSSGAVGVLQMLGQLERFDLKALGPDSPQAWHLFAESQRLAYADRDKWLGDPAFVGVPVAGLISRDYIARRSALIRDDARLAQAEPGLPAGAPERQAANDNEVAGTSHFAVAAADGSVATYTSTVERSFGSGIVAAGMVLNNELTDFNFAPEDQGALTANAVSPGKRPRSSMSPTIVYDRQGRVVVSLGAAGGSTIIAQVAKTLIATLD